MKDSFQLVWRSLVRAHVPTLLAAATGFVYWLMPSLVRSDGTAAGYREMSVRALSGSVCTIVGVAILSLACSLYSREREERRLSLALVRPVGAFAMSVGRWGGFLALAALMLALNASLALFFPSFDPFVRCNRHHAPALPPAIEAARGALDEYLASPETPPEVKQAPRREVLALLANKEQDRYDVIPPGGRISWPFAPAAFGLGGPAKVRIRFATRFELSSPMAGEFVAGGAASVVSNNTQAIIEVPIVRGAGTTLEFHNTGRETVMLRPRRDLEILVPADARAANLARSTVQVFADFALLAAFGIFLSSALSRPTAIFTAVVAVIVAMMAPSVVEQYPDGLGAPIADRIGLAISRAAGWLTAAAVQSSPIEDFATDRMVEWGGLVKSVLVNGVLLPMALLAAASFVVRRKPL